VVSLIDRDPPQAKRMTERLIGYMRHTLDASRRDNATVADELAIIGDYLEILRLRMGERLNYAIVADDATRALPLPPMLLQPLIENAVKHGLEPKIDGGHIHVRARTQDSELLLVIEDSGLGFGASADTAGAGTGLANVRARLAALYGESARLEIESGILESDNKSNFVEPKRVVSTRIKITIPLGF
jgi:sensor histidine kinase YesM